ncbi:MAG TPA: hypothetical protein VEJ87_16650 [Acidimicrobiales bacterium]|nr:hypothetical protein [Acidimicrobiales bacterium]
MIHILAVASATSARHLQEIGAIVGGAGALALLISGVLGFMEFDRRTERIAIIIAGLLLGVGFLLILLGLHKV